MLIRHNAMHIRYATQRQHIVDSVGMTSLHLRRLLTLTWPGSSMRCSTNFMPYPSSSHPPSSPSSSVPQGKFQLSHPREFGPRRTLRFRFMLIFLFNAGSFWNHLIPNAPHSRSVVLDFVGMGTLSSVLFSPLSPTHSVCHSSPRHHARSLLLLDLLIIVLSVIVTTVAYETTYARAVTKAAIRATLDLTPATFPTAHTYADPLDRGDDDDPGVLVLDLRPSLLLRHMRSPPPPPPDDAPLPNGTTVVEGLRVLLQAQRSFRARQQTPPAEDAETQTGERVRERERERERRVPGGMDPPEDGG
ncbi:hypothetical protein EDB89DRAFT_1968383 [Lactarius sanguifluus]|nr:hypothetical protein EDB89DRAFT_1968383 [Lactarius sanguifluus]